MKKLLLTITLAIAIVLPASASAKPTQTDLNKAVQAALTKQDRSASAAKKKHTRIKLPVYVAAQVTNGSAFDLYLDTFDALDYGTNGCSRYSPYGVTCIGWISGDLDLDSNYPYFCDWYEDVWINKKNILHAYAYDLACYPG